MRTSQLLSLLVVAIATLASLPASSAGRGKLAFSKSSPLTMPSDSVLVDLPTPPHPAPSTGRPLPPQPAPSSTAAPVEPAQPAVLNLTWPYSAATLDTYTIRLVGDAYYIAANATRAADCTGCALQQRVPVDAAQAALKAYLGDDAWKKQQKRLRKHMKYVDRRYSADAAACTPSAAANATDSCRVVKGEEGTEVKAEGGERDSHHGSAGSQLAKFYLRHAQCNACVQNNRWALTSASSATASTTDPFASYQPVALMKWCTLAAPKLAAELPPSEAGAALADWEGVCVPAEAACPSATVDMNVLSPSTCARDEPASKHSCSLCVLDGYHWTAAHGAFKRADNYDGSCYAAPTATYSGKHRHADVVVSALDGCPSVVASVDSISSYQVMASSFGLFVMFTGLLLLCLCMRACCQARKARQLSAARGVTFTSVAVPAAMQPAVAVPTVSSSPSPSAPPASGYPASASVAVAHEYSQPLLSHSGLNPPRFSAPPAYPQVQAYRV